MEEEICNHDELIEMIKNGNIDCLKNCTIIHASGCYCYLCPKCNEWINHQEVKKIIEGKERI